MGKKNKIDYALEAFSDYGRAIIKASQTPKKQSSGNADKRAGRNNPDRTITASTDRFGGYNRAKAPDNSKLNSNEAYRGVPITRTRAIRERYNEDTLADPANFIIGTAKQIWGGYESMIGTGRNKVGGYNSMDALRLQNKYYLEQMRKIENPTSDDSKKAYEIARKQSIADAEKLNKENNEYMMSHGDKLLREGSEDLEKVKSGKNKVEKAAIDISSAGVQMLADAFTGRLIWKGAKLGTKGLNRIVNATTSARASGNAMSEARQDGATEDEQIKYGLLSGSVEYLTNKLGNIAKPFKAMYGKGVSDDMVEELARGAATKFAKSKAGKDLAYNLTKLGAAATQEGAEEMISEAVSPALKNMTYSEGEEVDWGEVLYSGIIGGTLGLVGGGAGQAVDYKRNNDYAKQSGLEESENLGALISEGLASDETTAANKIARQLKDTIDSGREVTPTEIVAQQKANAEAIQAETYAYEKQKGIAEKAASEQGLAPIMLNHGNGEMIVGGATAQRLKDTTSRVSQKLVATQAVDEGSAMDTAASISRIMVGMGDGTDFTALLPTIENEPARQVYMEETGTMLPDTNEGTRTVLSQANMENMLMMRREETAFQAEQQKADIIKEAETSFGKEGAAIFANAIQESDGDYGTVMQEFKNYYDGGTVNYPAAQIDAALGQSALSYPMKMAAWNAGFKNTESRRQADMTSSKNDINSKKKYSIQYTTENRPVVKIDRDITKGKPANEWQKVAREELKKFKSIPIPNNIIFLNKDGRKEMTKGRDLYSYKNDKMKIFEDKLKTMANVDEVVWASTDYVNEEPTHARKDAIVDFARGKVNLRIGENDYLADVIIGNTKENKLVLYDITKFTPTTFTLKNNRRSENHVLNEAKPHNASTTSVNNSIPNLKKDGNPKNTGTFKSYVAPAVVPKEKQNGLRQLAKGLNVNIELHPILEHDANGYYKDGTIHLSAKTDNPMMSVFKHELTHHIQETAPAEYQKLKDFVMQEYYKGDKQAFQRAIDEKVQAYAKQGAELTRDQAVDEIIANSTEKFLTDEAAIEKVVKQDHSLGQTILDAIRKMIDSIKGLLADAKNVDRGYSRFLEDLGILGQAEKLWVDALKMSVKRETTLAKRRTKYELNQKFSQDVDEWYGNPTEFNKKGGFFNIGTTSEALKSVGVKDNDIIWDKSKVKKILNDHEEMTIDVIKSVPQVLENPIIVMQSKTRLNSITVFGEVYAGNLPVLVAMQLNPKSKTGRVLNLSKVASAYGHSKAQGLLDSSDILYIEPNKNRTNNWLRALGLQLPVGLTKYGSIGKLTYYRDVVNNMSNDKEPTAMEIAMEKAKRSSEKKFSLKEDTDITYDSLVKKPDMRTVEIKEYDLSPYQGIKPRETAKKIRDFLKHKNGVEGTQILSVWNQDQKKNMEIGIEGLKHGLIKGNENNLIVSLYVDEYLKNAIKVNETVPDNTHNWSADIMLGYGRTSDNDIIPAYFVVKNNQRSRGEIVDFGSLYSVNGKKISEDSTLSRQGLQAPTSDTAVEAVGGANQGVQSLTSTTISISDLLDVVNKTYSDILPKSVADHYGNTRRESKLGKSVRYSLKEYSDHQKENWASSKSIVIYENDEQLSRFIDDALNKKNLNKKIYFGIVPDALSKRVLEETGVNIKDYNCTLKSYEVIKILQNSHGDEAYESARGQRAITKEDISMIPKIIENPDKISLDSKLYEGKPVIKFEKTINGKTTVVSYVSKKHHDLTVQTMYAGKKNRSLASATDAPESGPLSVTSKTTSGTASTNIIANNDGKNNGKKYSFKDHPDEQALIDYVNAGIETKFTDMPPIRDYDKKAKIVRMKSVEELTRQVEQLQQETKLTHGKMPDQRDLINQSTNLVRTLMAGKVKKNLVDMAANNASQMFTQIKRGHEEDAIIQAYNTARELVENIDLVDDAMYTEYKSLRDYLRKTPIKVSDNDKPADYEDFRRSQLGRLKLTSKDGLPVDTIYEELKELYPALFSEDIINPADQLQEIADVRESLEPYDVMLSDEETEQLIKETASSLLEIAYNGKPRQTFADKKKAFFDAKVKRLKEEQKEAKDKIRKQYQGIVKKHDEKARQRRIEDKRKARNKAEKKRSVGNIEKNVDWLSDRLLKPTDDKHLPHGFSKAVADLLQCFDLQTDRSKALEVKFGKAKKTLNFESLMRQYQKIAKEDGSGEVEYDGYVFDMMDALAEKLEGKTIDQASNQDLKDIDTLLKAVVGNFKNMNKAFTDGVKATISDMGDAAITEFQRRTTQRKGKGKSENLIDRLLNESMVTPRDFFELMGGNMETLYGNIRKGFDDHVRNIAHTREFFEELFQKYNKKKKPGSKIQVWSDAKSQVEFKLQQGGTIKLNPAQIMTLYCLNKREQAQGHIYASGIVASEVSEGKKLKQRLRGERSNTSKTSFVTVEDMQTILGMLTEEQIQIAEKLMGYLNTECTKWGNETSLRMNNYEKFTEDNYFPIISAKEYLDVDFSKRSNNIVETIKNASFTKSTAINANNPIMVADIFEVVTDHINKMSMYNAFAAPIADFQRVYNYKQRDESGLQTTSVQAEMREACGQKALEYIKNLMADLNNFGNLRREPFEALLNKGLTAYKKAAIGFNFRVAIQQPTAIARAFVHINPIYFVNGKINLRKNLQEMKEHCPIALWKSWGFSQTDVARDMKDIIMNDNWTKLDLVSMMPYGALDNATWATIWAAVKTETEAKHKDVKVGSDQFWKICSERAAYIYDKTQVVDSPLHRSQVMRNPNVGLKMLTSFMAEPIRTFNMCRTEALKGIQNIKDGNLAKGIGEISKVSTVFLLNAALVSAAAAVADAIREKLPGGDDDDEEKSKAEYWLINFWANLGDNLNPLNMIPALKEYGNIKDGWGTSNMALEGAEAIITAATNWQKYMNGETDKTPAELMRKSAEAVGMVTGVPIKNIIREFESWTKLIGLEAHAATEGDEAEEKTNWLLDKFEELKTWMNKSNKKDGDSGKKSSNKKAWKDQSYDEKLETIKEVTKDLSGSELEEKIWDKATYGYTTLINKADFAGIAETRKLLEEAGGDVDKFDDAVLKEVKSSFKNVIGSVSDENKLSIYKDYMLEHGYTEGKIKQDLINKSDAAKAFKEAAVFDDEEKMVNACAALLRAGAEREDIYILYETRSKWIKAADYSTGEMVFPTSGSISSSFGYRPASATNGIGSTDHKGIDIKAPSGSDVLAADGGKVVFDGYNNARGAYIRISHGNGRTTLYQHLQDYSVKKGDVVKQGQVIAHVGSTGNSTGPHLHFEVQEGGTYIDPMIYFQ